MKTQTFVPVILFFDEKKVVKKGYCENGSLSLAWDRMGVC